MDVILKRCAGLDIHKKSVTACVLLVEEDGQVRQLIRTFGTMTRQLLELADWLGELGVTEVAMESTGVLWKPIFNILDGSFRVMLVNAQHIKNVPGRKTDVKDSQWIAQLLQHGLLSPSFVPERPLRELRDLTRHRAQLSSEKAREINRIHKVLEDANIKLGAVASDIMGVSGRAMLQALMAGQLAPAEMAGLAQKKLRAKLGELELALEGQVGEHHRFLLRLHYEHVLYLEELLARMSQRIAQLMGEPPEPSPGAGSASGTEPAAGSGPEPGAEERPQPEAGPGQSEPGSARLSATVVAAFAGEALPPLSLAAAAQRLDQVPGIDLAGAQDLLAEIGTDMSRFPTHKHLCSWARLCPGNHESAGKRTKGQRSPGNRWLGRVLCEMAWAASHTKDTYLAALYKRLARRRGKKRALVALGHAILTIVYHMLKYQRPFQELGADFFERLEPERVTQYHVQRLEAQGFKVNLEKEPVAA